MEPLEAEYYRVNNPVLSLYITRKGKGLNVNRVSDEASIATTFIRDFSQIVGCHWDNINGQYISIVFKDGSVRINDVFKDGKLTAFLRTQKVNTDCSYWDRIEEEHDSTTQDNEMRIDSNLLDLMPTLIKFVGDMKSFTMVSYVSSATNWRSVDKRITHNRLLDIHMLHQSTSDELTIIMNGDYIMCKKPVEAKTDVPLCKVVNVDKGKYDLWYVDGMVKQLDVVSFLQSYDCMSLLETVLTLRDMNKYIMYHNDLLHREIISPYTSFLKKVSETAYGMEKLHKEMRTLFLLGEVSEELSDWLHYSIGERNIAQWRQLCFESYQKSNEVLTLAYIPACERMIILVEQCQGLVMTLDPNITSSEIPEFIKLKNTIQDMLELTIRKITESTNQVRYVESLPELVE